jgi:hypothetical protein
VEVIGLEVAITPKFLFLYGTEKHNRMQQNEILINVSDIDIQRCSEFSKVCSMARGIVQEKWNTLGQK